MQSRQSADDADNAYDDEDFDDDFEDESVEDTEEPKTEQLPSNATVAATFTTTSGRQIPVPTVPVDDGVQIWEGDAALWEVQAASDSTTLSEVPPHFTGGQLLRLAPGALGSARSQLQVISLHQDARLYVVLEVPNGKSEPGTPGLNLLTCLSSGQRWLSEGEAAPSWFEGQKKRPDLAMFSTFAPRGVSLSLPQVIPTGESPRGFVVLAPLLAGNFNVSMTSTIELPLQKVLMDEGVVAWGDRDHQYFDVPEYLKHGVLFQQPFKDIPKGAALTVRPNSAATVYVITERRSGTDKPSWAEELGASWHLEEAAPRWHELPTMRTYSRYCPAGWPLALPPCHAPPNDGPVFSVVVTPVTAQSTAPLEVSSFREGELMVDFSTLEEGSIVERASGLGTLVEVPGWMQGAMLIRGAPGASFALRPAAASVVYAVLVTVEPPRWGQGWEARDEAPLWQPEEGLKARTVVLARRVLPRELLGVPPNPTEEVLALAVKVDVEAFDALVECNNGLEFAKSQVKETGMAWTDRQNRLAWIPECMKGGLHFRGPHEFHTRPGLQLRIRGTSACRTFVAIETGYKGGHARSGRGLPELLLQNGWHLETAPSPAWQDTASSMKLFSKRCAEGQEMLMPLCGEEQDSRMEVPLLFMIMVVGLGPEHVGEELRRSFAAWAPSTHGLGEEQVWELLKLSELDPGKRKMVLNQTMAGPKGPRKVIPCDEFVEKLLRFAAVGERQA